MKELVDLIVKKTGIPAVFAQAVATMVVDFLKQNLPVPVAGQIDVVLKNKAPVKTAEDVLSQYASKLRRK